MTPKEKAIEFYLDFYYIIPTVNDLGEAQHGSAKQCALIAVNKILEALYSLPLGNAINDEIEYYEQVKEEIENL